MKTPDPDVATIKVTDGESHAYFVRFDRATRELLDVFEYKKIYSPRMGAIAPRTKIIVDLAKSKIDMPRKTPVTIGV